MKYLYPTYKNQYKSHVNKYDYLCTRNYGITMLELMKIENKTPDQQSLVDSYNKYNPLLETDCEMNNVCRYMESKIKEVKINVLKKTPDYIYDILFNKEIEITEQEIQEMESAYKKYKKRKAKVDNIENYAKETDNVVSAPNISIFDFYYISTDIQKLANLAVYVNYYLYPNSPKNFCWDIFGDGIILNIYDNSNKEFKIPIRSDDGDIEYMGKRYKNERVNIECL